MKKLVALAFVMTMALGTFEASARGMGGEMRQNKMYYMGSGCCPEKCPEPCPADPCDDPCPADPCDPCAPCCPEVRGLFW